MDKLDFIPGDVRGGGNIIIPSDSLIEDVHVSVGNSKLNKYSGEVNGRNMVYYYMSNINGMNVVFTAPRTVIGVTATVNVSVNYRTSGVVTGAEVYVELLSEDKETVLSSSKQTVSSGALTFNIILPENIEGHLWWRVRSTHSTYGQVIEYAGVWFGDFNSIILEAEKPVIQDGEISVLKSTVTGIVDDAAFPIIKQRVDFYKEYTPNLNLTADKSIIQAGETSVLTATIRDSDDDTVIQEAGNTVYFYEVSPGIILHASSESVDQYSTDNNKCLIVATLYGANGEPKQDTNLKLYQGETVVLDTVTDSNGQITYEYTASGLGEIIFACIGDGFMESLTVNDIPDVDFSYRVTFNDDDNPNRPSMVKVSLLENGIEKYNAVLSDENFWRHTFSSIPDKDYTIVTTNYENINYTSDWYGSKHDVVINYTVHEGALQLGAVFTFEDNGDYEGNPNKEENIGFAEFIVTGPDTKTPRSVTYDEFADGSLIIGNLKPGSYEVVCNNASSLVNGGVLENDSLLHKTCIVEDGETSTGNVLFLHYSSVNDYPEPTPPTVKVSGYVRWDDFDNVDGNRPSSLTVSLYVGSGEVVDTVTVSDSNYWSFSFDGLPEGVYSVGIPSIPHYSVVKRDFDFTCSYTREYVDKYVQLVFDDDDDSHGVRPDHVRCTWDNGVQVLLSDLNDWLAGVEFVKYLDGVEHQYTVSNETVENYRVNSKTWDGNVCTIVLGYWVAPNVPSP